MMRAVVFLVGLMMSSCSVCGEMKSVARIYYVPIGVETYVPMTMKNIEEHHVRFAEVDVTNREFEKLMSLIEAAASGSFEEKMVRAKIALPDASVLYVDNDGGVKRATTQTKLDEASLKEAKKLLEKITKPRQKE